MLKLMITGSGGLLGAALAREGRRRDWEVLPMDARDLYVMDPYATRSAISAARPDVLVHCLAYPEPDRAELEPEKALRINRTAARNVASACASLGCIAVFPSSYMVFDGEKDGPYEPQDNPGPINAWGQSLHAAEMEVENAGGRWMVVRTGWVYGQEGATTLDRLAVPSPPPSSEGEAEPVVSPTWSRSLARALLELVVRGGRGLFHVADRGETTLADLVRTARELEGREGHPESDPTTPPLRAPRPRNGVLDSSRAEALFGREMPHWRESLERYITSSSSAPASSTH